LKTIPYKTDCSGKKFQPFCPTTKFNITQITDYWH